MNFLRKTFNKFSLSLEAKIAVGIAIFFIAGGGTFFLIKTFQYFHERSQTSFRADFASQITKERNPIVVDYEKTTPIVRERVKDWYDKHYVSLHNLIGGPCRSFRLTVLHDDGGFVSGFGGMLERRGVGEDTFIRANGPLGESKNFEHVLAHEFSHAFQAGIWMSARGLNVAPSWVEEGIAEYLAQTTLVFEVENGESAYRRQPSYLPSVITSYDSYKIQKDASGGLIYWGDNTDFNTMQAQVLWALMEEVSPGFLQRFQEKICSLSQQKSNPAYGKEVIRLSLSQAETFIEEAFGPHKIEGKRVLDWLRSQPVSNTYLREGTSLRIQFRNKSDLKEELAEGISINPEFALITEVTISDNQYGGEDSINFSIEPEVEITDWNDVPISVPIEELDQGIGINIQNLHLPEGVYKITARNLKTHIEQSTYFLIWLSAAQSPHTKVLFGTVVNNGSILAKGLTHTSLGEAEIAKGFFSLGVPDATQEIEINFNDEERVVFIPDWTPLRFIILDH